MPMTTTIITSGLPRAAPNPPGVCSNVSATNIFSGRSSQNLAATRGAAVLEDSNSLTGIPALKTLRTLFWKCHSVDCAPSIHSDPAAENDGAPKLLQAGPAT